jgi:type IV fimbrial biogenesis protein FimT
MTRRRTPAPQAGFTLIELLVVMTVLGFLMRLAVPSFAEAIMTNRMASYSNTFIGSAQFARSEAIKRNVTLTLCASADGASCTSGATWAQGWIVTCPANTATDAMCNAGGGATLILQKQPALPADYHFTSGSGGYSISFPASGVGATQTSMTLCRWSPQPGDQERQVAVTATGRPAVATTHNASCT